ncbi:MULTISPECIES: aldehyde dehydrogenase [unclassified Pseudonocardia]|uniref:aldehyde dehydrogenase family protein n=1 Tax=unclassified Pseudonocardia TaxID=2619320 RepID=UPI0009E7D3C6|nr:MULTISPECIES: aldehyde dehydrogenase family protein [unclassified Pseudonocardia]
MTFASAAPAVTHAVSERLTLPPHLFVDGAAIAAGSGEELAVVDPANGHRIGTATCGDAGDVDRAVQAAARAFRPGSPWRTTTPLERGKILHRIGDAILERADEFAELEVLDAGKVRGAARSIDVDFAARAFHYFAGWPTKIVGSTVPTSHPGIHIATEKVPVGVVGAITAWNFPLLLCGWKLAPALAAGCTVVLKPSEETPHSALWLAELAVEAGLPPGVLNVVPGRADAGQALVDHPLVDKITFTGSTAVGKEIARRAADQVKRVSLELGGKSANIIFADADLDAAVEGSAGGLFWHSGQTCSAPSRLFVHRSVHDEVVARLTTIADGLSPGHGLDDGTELGPLVNAAQQDKVAAHVRLAREQGATVHVGPDVPAEGFFHPATIVSGARDEMACATDEIFGPVLTVLSFDDTYEVLRRADASEYGLAAGVWTRDVSTAHRATRALRAGTVYVNGWGLTDPAAPFGGFRQSGYGRDLGPDSLEGYLETKSVWTFHG